MLHSDCLPGTLESLYAPVVDVVPIGRAPLNDRYISSVLCTAPALSLIVGRPTGTDIAGLSCAWSGQCGCGVVYLVGVLAVVAAAGVGLLVVEESGLVVGVKM